MIHSQMTAVLLAHLRKFLTTPVSKNTGPQTRFWFSLSLTFAAIYGIMALQQAFGGEYVVADDARQHVFWMQRFLDPELFPNDLIADYFQSVAPRGYTAIYQLMASLGIQPLFLSKILPLGLGLITTAYCFWVCMEMLPVPAAGFIASWLLTQNTWMVDELASGTPKAFVYPLLMAFLYYLLRRSLLPCLAVIVLQGLFYPQSVFVSAGLLWLRLWDWKDWQPRLSRNRRDRRLSLTGLGVALLVMLPYAVKSSQFAPVITSAQARTLPEFWTGGRTVFFNDNSWSYWICGGRSGLLPLGWCQNQPGLKSLVKSLLQFPQLWAGLLLPILLRFPCQFPLAKRVTNKVFLLPQMALISSVLFLSAHGVLFKLHLPSRYTRQSFRFLMALAAGIAIIVLLEAVLRAGERHFKLRQPRRQLIYLATVFALSSALVLQPVIVKATGGQWFHPDYRLGKVPDLYRFLAQQPKDTLTASLALEADNLPTFSRRSVLVSREYAIPYHLGYYTPFRQRAIDLVRAQYSPDLGEVKNFIEQYGVDLWLLDRNAFIPEYLTANTNTSTWIRQFQPAATEALTRLEQGKLPAILPLRERCAVFETESLVVLSAECIVKSVNKT